MAVEPLSAYRVSRAFARWMDSHCSFALLVSFCRVLPVPACCPPRSDRDDNVELDSFFVSLSLSLSSLCQVRHCPHHHQHCHHRRRHHPSSSAHPSTRSLSPRFVRFSSLSRRITLFVPPHHCLFWLQLRPSFAWLCKAHRIASHRSVSLSLCRLDCPTLQPTWYTLAPAVSARSHIQLLAKHSPSCSRLCRNHYRNRSATAGLALLFSLPRALSIQSEPLLFIGNLGALGPASPPQLNTARLDPCILSFHSRASYPRSHLLASNPFVATAIHLGNLVLLSARFTSQTTSLASSPRVVCSIRHGRLLFTLSPTGLVPPFLRS